MAGPTQSEIERIRDAYRERDASAVSESRWVRRAYRLRMQELEDALLDALHGAGVDPLGQRVLEVGCGSGYFLSRFLDYGAEHAAGIDLMDHRVAQARRRDPRLELIAGDASELPWPDASFDVVSQFTCLSSILDAELRRRVAAEMWRVLRPGGALVSYDMGTPPGVVRALRSVAMLRGGRRAVARTPTTAIDRLELGRLFPGAALDCRRVTLSVDVASVAERSAPLLRALGALPFLRTHLLAVGPKPG